MKKTSGLTDGYATRVPISVHHTRRTGMSVDSPQVTNGLHLYKERAMADDRSKTGAHDRDRINIHEDYEVQVLDPKVAGEPTAACRCRADRGRHGAGCRGKAAQASVEWLGSAGRRAVDAHCPDSAADRACTPSTLWWDREGVSFLTEELVALGHDVTSFASGDSSTRAKLIAGWPRALRADPSCSDTVMAHVLMMDQVSRRASEFDVLHFHFDYWYFSLLATPRHAGSHHIAWAP